MLAIYYNTVQKFKSVVEGAVLTWKDGDAHGPSQGSTIPVQVGSGVPSEGSSAHPSLSTHWLHVVPGLLQSCLIV